jgi:integrase
MARQRTRARSGSGSVYWAESQKRYVGEVTLGYDDDGARIRELRRGPRGDKSEEARLGVRDQLQDLVREKRPTPETRIRSRITVKEFFTSWLSERDPDNKLQATDFTRRARLSPAAFEAYTWAVDQYIVPEIGKHTLHKVDSDLLRNFLNSLKLGDESKLKIRNVMQAAFQDATTCKRKFITMNPAARLDFDRDGTEKEKAIWTEKELKQFLQAVKTSEHSEYFPLFLLMVFGALGPAEAFNLQWKDVTLGKDKGSVTIVRKLKNRFRRRNVALRGDLLTALKARQKKLKPAQTDYVFTGPTGGLIQDDNFRKRVWQPLVKLAKVPMITPYGLRHTSASLMAAMGVPLVLASKALGHSNIKTTAGTYTHLYDESQGMIADAFGKKFKGI